MTTPHPTELLEALFTAARDVNRAAQDLDDTPLNPQRAQAELTLTGALDDLRRALSAWTPQRAEAVINLIGSVQSMDIHEINSSAADLDAAFATIEK